MDTPPVTAPPQEPAGFAAPLPAQDAWRLALLVGLPYWVALSAIRVFSFELTILPLSGEQMAVVPTLGRALQYLLTSLLAVTGYAWALKGGWRGPRAVLMQATIAILVAASARPILIALGVALMPGVDTSLAENFGGFGASLWIASALDVLASYAFGLVLLVGVRSALALRDQQLAAAALRNAWMQARLQSLRMQLSPHFLFNSLNAVATLIEIDPPRARRLVVSISDLFRRALAAGNSEWTTLAEEVAFARDYLDVQSTRFESRLTCRIDEDPAAAKLRVPVMLLQPLVENSLAHGTSGDSDTLEVWLRTDREHKAGREQLVIEVGNRSTGPIAAGRGGTGIGLGNTQGRLETIYGDRASLALRRPDDNTFIVTLTLPVEE
jgi:two-component system, LytTR family, sensor kinase